MIRAAECAKPELPEGYWSFIEEHLPDYSRRDDVLRSDIFTRYLEGGAVQEVDYQNFFAHRTREEIEKEYWEGERKLFMEALSNSVSRKHPVEGATSPSEFVPQHFLKEKFHRHVDGVYYVDADKVCEVNEFLRQQGGELFVYEVTGGMDDAKMDQFNHLFKEAVRKGNACYDVATAERMNYLHRIGCDLKFVDTAKPIARANLIICGGMEMPALVAGMLKAFYYANLTGSTTMEDCVKYLVENDVVNYGLEDLEAVYRGKIGQLLLASFTGMRLAAKWNGRQAVNGGYIVVKNDGDVVAFPSTIADEFKDFLVSKIIMESPSQSRHKDMVIYKEGNKYYLKLPLQFRLDPNSE